MTHKVWTVNFPDGQHTIELEHGYFSGKKVISVDGRVVHESKNLFDMGGNYPILVARQPCTVVIRTNGFTYSYDLRTNDSVEPVTTPGWAWLFVAACILIPILTLGGAIPGGLGAGGAAACYSLARNKEWGTMTRVAACLGVTVLCWGLIIGLGLLTLTASRR